MEKSENLKFLDMLAEQKGITNPYAKKEFIEQMMLLFIFI